MDIYLSIAIYSTASLGSFGGGDFVLALGFLDNLGKHVVQRPALSRADERRVEAQS